MADIVAPPTDQPPVDQTIPAVPEPATVSPEAATELEPRPAAPVPHTPGGWPAAPLALLSANTAVAGAAASALAAGPLFALLAAGGTATVLAAGGQVRRRTDRRRGQTATSRATGSRSGGLLPRPRTDRSAKGAVGATGRRAQQGRRNVNPRTGSPTTSTSATRASARGTARGGARPVGQVKALRDAHRAAHPSRAARREQRVGDRHRIADARRQAQRQARQQRAAAGGRGPRALLARASTSPKAQQRQAKQDAARVAKRAKKGQTSSEKVTAKRKELRRQPVRRAARWRLRRSAARFHARRTGNGLLALPVMLLGVLTTWAGRKLGIQSLMHPGHRLFRWLNRKAWVARYARDQQIHRDLEGELDSIDRAEAEENSATNTALVSGPERTVERAPLSHNANTNLGVHVTTAGFDFAEAAAEMEAQAQSFEPDGMMQVLSAFEGMPEAMHSVARTFQILAERSDAEFPLEKEVGEALNDVFQQLQQAIGACEEVATTMRRVHEQDIRRHEDPRNGEDKWDTGNNN